LNDDEKNVFIVVYCFVLIFKLRLINEWTNHYFCLCWCFWKFLLSSKCCICICICIFVCWCFCVFFVLFLRWFQFSKQRSRIDTNDSKWLSSICSTIDGNVLEERSWSASCILSFSFLSFFTQQFQKCFIFFVLFVCAFVFLSITFFNIYIEWSFHRQEQFSIMYDDDDDDDEIELRLNTLTILFFVERQWKQFVRCFQTFFHPSVGLSNFKRSKMSKSYLTVWIALIYLFVSLLYQFSLKKRISNKNDPLKSCSEHIASQT
jgi:hypothetical protein